MNDTTATATEVFVTALANGDTIVVDPRGAGVRAVVVDITRVNYVAQTLVVIYRESDTGTLREWATTFTQRVGTY